MFDENEDKFKVACRLVAMMNRRERGSPPRGGVGGVVSANDNSVVVIYDLVGSACGG